MHLLFATSIVPDGTLGSGYEIANATIIDALRRAGVRVTVLGFAWPGQPPDDPENTIVLGEVDVRTEGASSFRKVAWLFKAIFSGLTYSSVKLRVVPPEAVRRAIADAGPFDAYILNSVQFAGAFEGLFDDRPCIFIDHNVEHASAQENARAAGGNFQRFLYRREARLLKALETRLCRKARFVFTLAEEDRAILGVASDDKSLALPLVVHPKAPSPGERAIEYDAALIGTWTWQPNRIGLEWFLNEVVPNLPDDFSIRIAGHVPAGVGSRHPGVKFVGHVPDADAFVLGASIIPLVSRTGTGVQIKTIETFELGLPSVATTNALRSIDYRPENCTVTDDPEAFAMALQLAAAGALHDTDGSAFHRYQRAVLDERIRRGLAALGHARQAVTV
ncbi:hypothetical protein M2281_000907 [Mesorhizobium soli]|uniref:glycosyltransferase n=1 Tax=Pseudaminobacter soli (ex Li et al. 2025) TaxID=1295366 RepID=UPI0024765664|nr:glycosyltransferase [Mesorhizobium soli]MDH6230335.1 hypothetical protein [Mesorhizobium soli]